MDDDLSVPSALAALQEVVHEGNKALADGPATAVRGTLGSVRAMLGVLGLDPLAPPWSDRGSSNDSLTQALDRMVMAALAQRQQARQDKDYAAADAVRDQLASAGIAIEDTPSGPRWTLQSED